MPRTPYRGGVLRILKDRRQRDWLVAALLGAASLAELWLGPGGVSQRLLSSVLALAVCAMVGLRRRIPTTAGAGAQGVMALDLYTGHHLAAGGWTIAWFCSLYGLAVWSAPRRFAVGAAFVGLTDLLPLGPDANPAHWKTTAVPFAVGTVVVMVLVRRIIGDRERRVRLAEREREVAAREAVVEERARIARELHDAIAHNVSMMVVQAGAERKALNGAGGSTRDVLQTIESIGRGALTEMRRLVGMLRTDQPDQLVPQPSLADLAGLASQVEAAGLPVELHVDGDRRELPVGIELSAYRIVQEALTNVLKHAGAARAVVRVSYRPDELGLEVSDDGAGMVASVPGGGHGLAGMRERALLYGGSFDAGPQTGGGYAVRVVLPAT